MAADEFRDLYPDSKPERFSNLYTNPEARVKRRSKLKDPDLYFGCISMLDHHIGRLMDYLDQNGLAENTLVVFDNGPEHRM